MSLKIIAGWAKKEQREPYGSESTHVSFELTLDDAERVRGYLELKALPPVACIPGSIAHEIAERFKELGLENFAAPITNVSCQDHNGHHAAFMQQWDGTKWVKISDWITPMKDKVRPMLEAAAKEYVSKDPAWPKRSEPCDKSS